MTSKIYFDPFSDTSYIPVIEERAPIMEKGEMAKFEGHPHGQPVQVEHISHSERAPMSHPPGFIAQVGKVFVTSLGVNAACMPMDKIQLEIINGTSGRKFENPYRGFVLKMVNNTGSFGAMFVFAPWIRRLTDSILPGNPDLSMFFSYTMASTIDPAITGPGSTLLTRMQGLDQSFKQVWSSLPSKPFELFKALYGGTGFSAARNMLFFSIWGPTNEALLKDMRMKRGKEESQSGKLIDSVAASSIAAIVGTAVSYPLDLFSKLKKLNPEKSFIQMFHENSGIKGLYRGAMTAFISMPGRYAIVGVIGALFDDIIEKNKRK